MLGIFFHVIPILSQLIFFINYLNRAVQCIAACNVVIMNFSVLRDGNCENCFVRANTECSEPAYS